MRYRVTSCGPLGAGGEVIRAVLEDFTPEGNWTDVQCATKSPFGQMLTELYERQGTLEFLTYYGNDSQVRSSIG